MNIHPLHHNHYPSVKKIYEQGIATDNATFQTAAPEWTEWDQSHLAHSRIVAIEDNEVVGWAALTPVSGRCVYAGVAEISVYIDKRYRGRGIGKILLQHLISKANPTTSGHCRREYFPKIFPV